MSEFTDSFHQLTASIIPQLTSFLQLRYQPHDQRQTLFTTHPTTMCVAVSSFIINYLLNVALLRSPTTTSRCITAVAQHFLVWSGYAAVSTLAAIVFPDRASPFLYVIFGFLSGGEVLYMFGYKSVTRDMDEDEDEDEDENDECEASKFEVCKRRVVRFLRNIICGGVPKFFRKQPQPILPI